MTEERVILIGKWELGFTEGHTVLRFPFTDQPPLVLALPHAQALALAQAIFDQNSPSTSRPIS